MKTERHLNTTAVFALALSLFSEAQAATVFFGEDLNSIAPTGDVDTQRLPTRPNAEGARQALLSHLRGYATEDFEGFTDGVMPTNLLFASQTASLSGGHAVMEIPTRTYYGVWPSSGSQCLFFHGAATCQVAFPTPQVAFGFYATDVGDYGGQLIVTLVASNGTHTSFTVPSTVRDITQTGSILFFGLLDTQVPFTSVTLSNTYAGDGIGLDDLIAQPVIPPPLLSIRVSQVEICWDTVANADYQLLYRDTLTSNTWQHFGSVVPGDGNRYCTNDWVLPGQPERYYRVVATNQTR